MPGPAEQLRDLLGVASAETRYGAFRALWTMNRAEPLVRGEHLGGQFDYHVLNTPGVPMIHVTRSERAEVVLFGGAQQFATPLSLNAGNQIMVTSTPSGEIAVSKFSVRDADQRRTRLDEGGRGDPGDCRVGRQLSRRRAGVARGEGGRRACPAASRWKPFPRLAAPPRELPRAGPTRPPAKKPLPTRSRPSPASLLE